MVVAALALAIALALGGLAPGIWLFAALWAIVGVSNGFANVDASALVLNRAAEFSRRRVLARGTGWFAGARSARWCLVGLRDGSRPAGDVRRLGSADGALRGAAADQDSRRSFEF